MTEKELLQEVGLEKSDCDEISSYSDGEPLIREMPEKLIPPSIADNLPAMVLNDLNR